MFNEFGYKASDKIILALDGMSSKSALSMVQAIPDLVWVKVGLELFLSGGLDILSELRSQRKKIFLDLKFHDIPNTMERVCYQASKIGIDLLTVHGCSGTKALIQSKNAALRGAAEEGTPPPAILAVTVLTSWDQSSFKNNLKIDQTINERVIFLAKMASQSGVDGCICSPMELEELRKIMPKEFILVTPGIREYKENLGDQQRVMTANQAISAGANKLVIGRPITESKDPRKAFNRICKTIDK